MTVDLKELEEAIETLNSEFYEQTEASPVGISYFPFRGVFHARGQAVMMFDIPIWDSDDDEREQIVIDPNSMEEDYEPLLVFLKRQANGFIQTIKDVKL